MAAAIGIRGLCLGVCLGASDQEVVPTPAFAAGGENPLAAVPADGEGAAGHVPVTDIPRLFRKGRAQYLAGDSAAAEETLASVVRADPDHREAGALLDRIAGERAVSEARSRERMRSSMVEDVNKAWQRPAVFEERSGQRRTESGQSLPLAQKLASIHVPSVSFNRVELVRVAQSLSALAEEFDTSPGGPKGVNVVLLDPTDRSPVVTLSLRNLSLKRVLDFVTDSVGYQYEVQQDAVVIRPGGETSALDTAFFPIARSTVIRMTGMGGARPPTAGMGADGFASKGGEPAGSTFAAASNLAGGGGEAGALRAFLQSAGVVFDSTPGASLAYDGSAMIVTQTPRNLERIRNILNRYNDVRQVEIEAKFMEVQQGALDEMGVTWNFGRQAHPRTDPVSGRTVYDSSQAYTTDRVNRTLSAAFTGSANGNSIVIDSQAVASTAPPRLPGAVALAGEAASLAAISGIVGDFNVNAIVRLLAQKSGSDLLSAPRVTVLSGNAATITVAQELRFPQSYGEIQSQVGAGRTAADGLGGGAAGVTITAGTPQDFTTRNVGVELKVTPTVEEDDYSISLDLTPKVTEFEGFVEYGGPSVAVSGGRTVTVPPGFHQPVFSVREVSTKVTLWDGATLVMGGLTREEVKKVHDKIPVLGDIPLFGRAFRSKGESSQKRNLLIFVTANLVSPGGSPKKQTVGGVAPSSLFQNPTIVTPERSATRTVAK
ncbi:MAG: type II secretory pathway, component PulD [Opitutaceae bacterium]|nr:type II secretory pathway, component PulD [Opitutaceae bacterium]